MVVPTGEVSTPSPALHGPPWVTILSVEVDAPQVGVGVCTAVPISADPVGSGDCGVGGGQWGGACVGRYGRGTGTGSESLGGNSPIPGSRVTFFVRSSSRTARLRLQGCHWGLGTRYQRLGRFLSGGRPLYPTSRPGSPWFPSGVRPRQGAPPSLPRDTRGVLLLRDSGP